VEEATKTDSEEELESVARSCLPGGKKTNPQCQMQDRKGIAQENTMDGVLR
jgi:hypothetical protein